MVINKVLNINKDIKKDKEYLKKDKGFIIQDFYFYVLFINNSIIIIKSLQDRFSFFLAASNNLVF